MDEFDQAYGPFEDGPPPGAWATGSTPPRPGMIDVTPASFLPYAPAWTAWLEHAMKCGPCTRATLMFLRKEDVYDNDICASGLPLAIDFRDAINEQHEESLKN